MDKEQSTSKIGGCLLIKKIGQGGMGAVYKAKQISMDRTVALKVLAPHLAKEKETRERFLKEAKSSAKLHHPNIISIHEAGFDSGYCYYTMEYIENGSVGELVKKSGALSEDRVLEIAYDVAMALHHAQQNNLIHRDIKPDNFMVTQNGGVKVCDLGLAKILDDDAHKTQEGLFMGTPWFTSPEQAKGDKGIDIRSDLYSLGASMFYMATGKPPFEADSPIGVITMHINDEPPLASEYKKSLSKGFVDLVDRLLEKDPVLRPSSPEEVMTLIQKTMQKHHKKSTRSFKTSARTKAVTKEDLSRAKGNEAPKYIIIGVSSLVVVFGLLIFFGMGSGGGEPVTAETNETTINSGVLGSFKDDQAKYNELLANQSLSLAEKSSRFTSMIESIYLAALPDEVGEYKKSVFWALSEQALAKLEKYLQNQKDKAHKKRVVHYENEGLKDLLFISKILNGQDGKFLNEIHLKKLNESIKDARVDYYQTLLKESLPVANKQSFEQLQEVEKKIRELKDPVDYANKLATELMKYYQSIKGNGVGIQPSTPENDDKPEEKESDTDVVKKLAEKLDGLLKKKDLSKALEEYGNTYGAMSKEEKRVFRKNHEKEYLSMWSIQGIYRDLTKNSEVVLLGEKIDVNETAYHVVGVGKNELTVLDAQMKEKTIPFHQMPAEQVVSLTTSLKSFDDETKFKAGVFLLLTGDKENGNKLIEASDSAIKDRFKGSIPQLGK